MNIAGGDHMDFSVFLYHPPVKLLFAFGQMNPDPLNTTFVASWLNIFIEPCSQLIHCFTKTLPGEGFQQVIHCILFKCTDGILVICSGEYHLRMVLQNFE